MSDATLSIDECAEAFATDCHHAAMLLRAAMRATTAAEREVAA
ncbi:MAG: hypothetical protein WEF50_11145 [Myxococcota bacterium]